VRSAAGRSHASVKLARWLAAERLGCLWLPLLGVEAFSFLPNAQGNGGDLARQRQARHDGLHDSTLDPAVTLVARFPAV
jgi:hypothetical protein